MSRIATEAGVSKGTLYNYFSGKAELFAAYVQRDCASHILIPYEEIANAKPEDVLTQIGRRLLTMLLSPPALAIYRMVIAEAEKFPELAEAFYAAGPARGLAFAAAYMRRATAAGQLRVADPDFAAEQFFALLQTRLCMKRRLRLIAMPASRDIDHVVTQAVRMFLAHYKG